MNPLSRLVLVVVCAVPIAGIAIGLFGLYVSTAGWERYTTLDRSRHVRGGLPARSGASDRDRLGIGIVGVLVASGSLYSFLRFVRFAQRHQH